jgi:hypothetical protein
MNEFDSEHSEILNNKYAEFQLKIASFQKYIELDYEADDALDLATLTYDDINRDPFLRIYYIEARRKKDPKYKHIAYKVKNMFFEKQQIAEFRGSFYKESFGFDVSVFENEDKTIEVNSDDKLDKNYQTFELFLNDLIAKNPLWFTYYYVRIDAKYKDLVEKQLKESILKLSQWIDTSIMATRSNWRFDDDVMGDFVKNEMKSRFEYCSVFVLFKETRNEGVDEIKEDEKDTYLDSLSTDELNKFYAVMVRNNPNKDLKILKEIEKIVYDRVNEE